MSVRLLFVINTKSEAPVSTTRNTTSTCSILDYFDMFEEFLARGGRMRAQQKNEKRLASSKQKNNKATTAS